VARAVGIDPGLHVTGYGLLERTGGRLHVVEAGTFQAGGSKLPLPTRLRSLYDAFVTVLEEFDVEAVAMETIYSHYAHPQTAILMAHARGVLCLAAGTRSVPVVNYSATEVKSSLTGNGRATKLQVQQAIRHALGLTETPEPPDVADALALAYCHLIR
jgi:crossover junction endodeoxyribonuclease RuvC